MLNKANTTKRMLILADVDVRPDTGPFVREASGWIDMLNQFEQDQGYSLEPYMKIIFPQTGEHLVLTNKEHTKFFIAGEEMKGCEMLIELMTLGPNVKIQIPELN
jgi:hypothetical protein